MANLCNTLIAHDIEASCESLGIKGLEADGKIINRADIDFSATVFDTNNPSIIKSLVLKTGKKAYDISQLGNTPFTGLVQNLNVGTYINTWTTDIPGGYPRQRSRCYEQCHRPAYQWRVCCHSEEQGPWHGRKRQIPSLWICSRLSCKRGHSRCLFG